MISLKYDRYHRDEMKPIREYINNMVEYLSRIYGDTYTKEQLEDKVKQIVKKTLKRPKVEMILHPSPGKGEIKTIDLLTYTNNALKDQIITPSGSTYCRPTVRQSIFKIKLKDDKAQRKVVKKEMFVHKANGDKDAENFANYLQSSIKIFMNSLPGGMGSPYNSTFDLAGYNSITSLGRSSVMEGYAYTERFIAANLYLPTVDSAINYIVTYVRVMDRTEVRSVLNKFNMYIPTQEDIFDYLISCVKNYCIPKEHDLTLFKRVVSNLSEEERGYIYYIGCFKHLMFKNDHIFKDNLKQTLRDDRPIRDDVKPDDLFKLDEFLVACSTTINTEHLNGHQVYDTPKLHPDGALHVISTARNIEELIDSNYKEIFLTFLRSRNAIQDLFSHPKMIYKCTIISDTDSVIFTMYQWVMWYMGKLMFTKESYSIVSFVIMMLTKMFEHVFALMSTNIGMIEDDIYETSMKNEFIYPIMIRTAVAKHYVGLVTVQEGTVLAKPEVDIKGKQFRGSDLPVKTTTTIKEYLEWLLETISTGTPLTAAEAIAKALAFEHEVKRSLLASEKDFFPTYQVRVMSDYDKSDPFSTKYLYWVLWQDVYAKKYGDVALPNKVYGIPTLGDGKAARSQEYIDALMKMDKALAKRYIAFLEKYPDKKIAFMIIPMSSAIPEEMVPVLDIRKLVYTNIQPFYLILRSLGIVMGDKRKTVYTLLSDMYDPIEDILPQ